MKKLITGQIDEGTFERLKELGFNPNQMVLQGTELLLRKQEGSIELQKLELSVREAKYNLERIIEEQQKVEFHEPDLTPRQKNALNVSDSVPDRVKSSGKNENIVPLPSHPSELELCKDIWARKTFIGIAGRVLNYDFIVDFDEYDEMYVLAKRFNHELAVVLHDLGKKDYSAGFMGYSTETVKRIDRMLGVNSFTFGSALSV